MNIHSSQIGKTRVSAVRCPWRTREVKKFQETDLLGRRWLLFAHLSEFVPVLDVVVGQWVVEAVRLATWRWTAQHPEHKVMSAVSAAESLSAKRVSAAPSHWTAIPWKPTMISMAMFTCFACGFWTDWFLTCQSCAMSAEFVLSHLCRFAICVFVKLNKSCEITCAIFSLSFATVPNACMTGTAAHGLQKCWLMVFWCLCLRWDGLTTGLTVMSMLLSLSQWVISLDLRLTGPEVSSHPVHCKARPLASCWVLTVYLCHQAV